MTTLPRGWINPIQCIFFSIGSILESGIQGIADVLDSQGIEITSIDPGVASINSVAADSPENEKSAKRQCVLFSAALDSNTLVNVMMALETGYDTFLVSKAIGDVTNADHLRLKNVPARFVEPDDFLKDLQVAIDAEEAV